ncbi:NUDIX hydrolase [Schleiferilactobacillus shenzhenensis]|uniref:NUDIX hydrolase n=1 Tax=Schleiferilactobacillus shenzhenensis TaxID=1231337 RepID=UPI000401E020|nr:NUDIX hydrolase [Schleiferilactobacillus shenzhenensis]
MLAPLTNRGKIISEKEVFQGRIFSVSQRQIHTPDGLTVERDVVTHIPAVVVLALTPDRQQALLNVEYRAGINAESYSLPAGLLDPGETALEAAVREVKEETGYVLTQPQAMTQVSTSEGFSSETNTLAWGIVDPNDRGHQHFDRDEFVNSKLVPFTDIVAAVKDGTIHAGQAVAAVTYYLSFLQK